MLEKALLLDQLNSKISHRPGPLELIEKNILHANEPIERIVKEGLVPFKVTNDDQELTEKNFLSFEDDSQSSESDLFQQSSQVKPELALVQNGSNVEMDNIHQETAVIPQEKHIFEALPTTSTGVINISLVPTNQLLTAANCATPISLATFKIQTSSDELPALNIPAPPPPPPKLVTYHVKPVVPAQLSNKTLYPVQITEAPITSIHNIPALVPSQSAVNQHVSSFIQNNKNFSAPGKEKNRKKCKSKAVSKARAIKFHEYKGPPNKMSSSSSSSSLSSLAANKKLGETNYELIMQQQCLLEYLEGIYKNPQMQSQALKADIEIQKDVKSSIKSEKILDPNLEKAKTFSKPHVTIFPSKPSNQSPPSSTGEASKDGIVADVAKLSKMKVSELKAYLKRVNLPVSGPKPLLIERLKPYLPLKPLEDYNDDASVVSSMMSEGNDFYSVSLNSVSSSESDMDAQIKDEDIVAEQQRKIEELQRKLQQSQQELEQMKQHKVVDAPSPQKPNIVFEPQFQLRSQMSTVFVVDVTKSPNPAENLTEVNSAMLLETPSSTLRQGIPDVEVVQNMQSTSDDEKETLSLCDQLDKEVDAESILSSSNAIPMSQDISDVLEILLKNGEWPEMSEDIKCLENNFIQNTSGDVTFSNINHLSPSKQFKADPLATQSHFNVLSPMNEDPASPIMQVTEESIDKMLGKIA